MAIETHNIYTEHFVHPTGCPNFTWWECRVGIGRLVPVQSTTKMDLAVLQAAQAVREHFGKSVKINSAYRTSAYNAAVGGSKASQHLYGRALDIKVSDVDPIAVGLYIDTLPYWAGGKGGLGVYSTDEGTGGFVHLDTRETKSRWISSNGKSTVSVSAIMPTVKKGSNGSAVTILQRKLGLTADGICGAKTVAAIQAAQRSHGLTADGICGAKTWAAIVA